MIFTYGLVVGPFCVAPTALGPGSLPPQVTDPYNRAEERAGPFEARGKNKPRPYKRKSGRVKEGGAKGRPDKGSADEWARRFAGRVNADLVATHSGGISWHGT
jgi:hypothetical protein